MKGFIFLGYLCSLGLFLNSCSMFTLWVTLEINLTFFILYFLSVCLEEGLDEVYNSLLYYFILQTLASMGLILGTSFVTSTFFYLNSISIVLVILFKMGLFPFHFWIYKLSSSIGYLVMPILLVLQKIPFFILLLSLDLSEPFIFMIIGALFGSLFILNSETLKDILVGSSIYSSIWLFLFFKSSFILFFFFTLIYYFFIMAVCLEVLSCDKLILSNFSNSMSMFFLMGVPPFPLFFFKYSSLEYLLLDFSMFSFSILWFASFVALVGYFLFLYKSSVSCEMLFCNSYFSGSIWIIFSIFLLIFFLL